MKRILLPIAVTATLASLPALGQQRESFPAPEPQVSMAPVQDVVMSVEQRLQDLGYAVTPDGQFDADLRNSVLLYQSNSGLRPTGNVDLETLAALGIDVDPSGTTTAMVQPEPGDQLAMLPADEGQVAVVEQGAEALGDDAADYPLLKDEHMSAPQIGGDARFDRFENYTGVPQPYPALAGEIAGIPPGFPEENLD